MSSSQWWVGGTGQQLYTAAANWSATRGGAGGNGPPIAGDDVHIVDGNSQIIGSDQSAIALASFELNFSPQGTQSVPPLSIGTSASAPLKIGLAAGALAVLNGQHGDIYIGTSFADANGMLVCNGTGNVFVCGIASAGGGSVVGGVNAGKVTINGDYAGTIQLLNLGTTMEVAASSTSTTLSVTVDRGRVTTFRSITTGEVSGTLITGGTAAITSLVTVRKNGLHNHRSTGTIAAETVKGGGTANSIGAPSGFTITNSTVYGDASFFVGSTNITYTNPTKRVGILLETPDYLP